jgi:hypothetical protein
MAEFKGKQENFVATVYSMAQGKSLQCSLPIDDSICLGIYMDNSHPTEGIEDGAFNDFTIEVIFMDPNNFETVVPPQELLTEDIVIFKSGQYFNDNFSRNNITFTNSLANITSEASGINSIAVGDTCHASGNISAAFGRFSEASGYISFAAGCGEASGKYSHAVNRGHASGESSHAVNRAYATGVASHAENNGNAHGEYSHAEGYGTIANGECQHVQGRLNIADDENKYAHIVGNGTKGAGLSDPDKHSNAHTLDWDGNAWFAGNVSIDGTPTDDKDLVTKKYVDDNKPIKFLTDAYGTASAWKVDINSMDAGFDYKIPPNATKAVALAYRYIDSNHQTITKSLIAFTNNTGKIPVIHMYEKVVDSKYVIMIGHEMKIQLDVDDNGDGTKSITITKTPLTLSISNGIEYTPTNDYNPATKKYVDSHQAILDFPGVDASSAGVNKGIFVDVENLQVNAFYKMPAGIQRILFRKNGTGNFEIRSGPYALASIFYVLTNNDSSTIILEQGPVLVRNNINWTSRTLTTQVINVNLEYEPTQDYNPATKKYVDDNLEEKASTEYVNNMLSGLRLVQMTKAEYEALTEKDPSVLYLIVN